MSSFGGINHIDYGIGTSLPTPVLPTPVLPTPVLPTPVSPTPVFPTPVFPTHVSPTLGQEVVFRETPLLVLK